MIFASLFNCPRLAGDYERAVEASTSAEAITSVLYPNDNTTCESSFAIQIANLVPDHAAPDHIHDMHFQSVRSCV